MNDNKLTITVDTTKLQEELAALRAAMEKAYAPPPTIELKAENPAGLTGLALAAAVASGIPKKFTRRQLFGLR